MSRSRIEVGQMAPGVLDAVIDRVIAIEREEENDLAPAATGDQADVQIPEKE